MAGDCVCNFLCRDGGCLADEGFLCPMEHDVEGLIKEINEQFVQCRDGTRSAFASIMTVGDLIRAYLKRQRGG